MKLNLVLYKLSKADVEIQEDRTDADGIRTIVLGCALPRMPHKGRYLYTTLVLSPGQEEVCLEERDAIKRRLGHLCTDVFGDDSDFEEIRANPEEAEDDSLGSHWHSIVPKR
jgi:hypothetical protein